MNLPLQSTLERLLELLEEKFQMPDENMTMPCEDLLPHHHFQDDLGFDSMDDIELEMIVAEEWEVDISEAPAGSIETVQQLADFIDAELAAET